MEESERDERDAVAEDVEDLDVPRDEADDVKGGWGGSTGTGVPPPPPPVG